MLPLARASSAGATQVTDQKYLCTGTLDPDITGTFEPIGPYEGKPAYKHAVLEWYLFWDGGINWRIDEVLGNADPPTWARTDENIEGEYTPVAPATGTATITVI